MPGTSPSALSVKVIDTQNMCKKTILHIARIILNLL